MFKKKKCENCNEKIKEGYEFCPYCGNPVDDSADWGMLGKDDATKELEQFSNSFFGGGLLGKMLGSTMKMLEKELHRELQKSDLNRTNFELIINGKRINPKDIKISRPQMKETPQQRTKKVLPSISDEDAKRISKLPKQEPTTNMRRLSNKVI